MAPMTSIIVGGRQNYHFSLPNSSGLALSAWFRGKLWPFEPTCIVSGWTQSVEKKKHLWSLNVKNSNLECDWDPRGRAMRTLFQGLQRRGQSLHSVCYFGFEWLTWERRLNAGCRQKPPWLSESEKLLWATLRRAGSMGVLSFYNPSSKGTSRCPMGTCGQNKNCLPFFAAFVCPSEIRAFESDIFVFGGLSDISPSWLLFREKLTNLQTELACCD